MKKLSIALVGSALACNALAFNEKDAAQLVKAYSKLVACQQEDDKYTAVKVDGKPGPAELGDRYVVFWYGDIGCSGGNGTISPNFTVVEMAAFNTPVVLPTFKRADIALNGVTKFTGKDGKISIEGVTYGPKDSQHNPTLRVKYTLKVDVLGFVKQ
ncbi:MAG: hypothetical protein PSV40_15685 [Polaromonas sp.]|uniref:hypothetical protein n=1 Tax=Polaromonas sp. TaxID=1869339 RepID=UPI0024890664|nr:hypothetical protein [Polaromonas sp.]MDI1270529.1 hypothetical protein [Polaromonas sp.]